MSTKPKIQKRLTVGVARYLFEEPEEVILLVQTTDADEVAIHAGEGCAIYFSRAAAKEIGDQLSWQAQFGEAE